ncbi:hypothetical protein Tsubulata_040241 [Turnera subulata]|uniref:E3 ubiquitin-protein ligase listerin n=1 Tax=Turnera subulata TaxID=218843 RepID=A0A9Q0J2X8_9ROSI|nr:hypothetical protein Tsubulata_040241 [Turnera subulata]
MGRQKGEATRTKSRPSSSGMAASLLSSSSAAAAAIGFGGYVGSSRLDPSVLTSSSTFDEASSSFLDVDREVAQHLKRLGRKDPTTKLKALQTLSALFKEKPGKDLVLAMPQWAFEYKKLLLDYNREVRRAANEAMANLVVAVGRDLAPHLKTLMGPWWFSQFDPVHEVSLAAKRSLQAAFPAQEKRLDALILCTAEIFVYLEENLKLKPESMSDKEVALDELEEMHQQVISSSLLALAALMDALIGVQSEKAGCDNGAAEPKRVSKARATAISFSENLFSSHNFFLDFLKSESPAIRSATYSVLKSFIKGVPQAFNEENMKALATAILGAFQEKDPTCHSSMWDAILLFARRFPDSWTLLNVQKTVLNRFWNFLRNGCYGSQQVSYPAVLLFLNVMPPKAVMGEKVFLDFFHNLWEGRKPAHSTRADRLAFFQATKECFLWGLHNSSRFCDAPNSEHHFRFSLVDNILVKLLWEDFIGSNNQDRVSKASVDPVQCKTQELLNVKCPMSYLQDLGKCIVETLSGIYTLDPDLLSIFRVAFQETCLEMFQQTENREITAEKVEKAIRFISLLEQHSVQKNQSWPFGYLIGPMLAKTFPVIKSLDISDGVKLLSVSVSLFGPRKFCQELLVHVKEVPTGFFLDDTDKELDSENHMGLFKDTFIPWCLLGDNSSSSARLDLLLALLDDECFSKQWDAIVSFATKQEGSEVNPQSLKSEQLVVLSMLLEKVRAEIIRRKGRKDSIHQHWSNPENWHHELLESAAVGVACSPYPCINSASQFLCAVVGSSSEADQISFVSSNSMVQMFREVFKKLLAFIFQSSFSTVTDVGQSLASCTKTIAVEDVGSIRTVDMARFALEVLGGSLSCLNLIHEEIGLLSGILASVFIIDWEYKFLSTIEDALDDESKDKLQSRLEVCGFWHDFRMKINDQFWRSLNVDTKKRTRGILIHFVRSTIFQEDVLNVNQTTSICCSCILEVLHCLCHDQDEEQLLLDQLLTKDDSWPLWITPDFSTQKASGSLKFVSVIDNLISKIGISKVVAGYDEHTLSSSLKEPVNVGITSRAWVAAEIMCSWKWPGGSAVASFLPLLGAYAKSEDCFLLESLLDAIFNILLDGALVHGQSHKQSSFDIFAALGDEWEKIEEPFLRALLLYIFTLFKNNIWGEDKAVTLYEVLVNKLLIGEATNSNCLNILPSIVSLLARPLCTRNITSGEPTKDTEVILSGEKLMQETAKVWLQRILLFPPLAAWESRQVADMVEWFQLFLACYTVNSRSGRKLKLERNASAEERSLILDLFRKQRQSASLFSEAHQLPVVRLLQAKLMVISIGYCWTEFTEEDWDYFFLQLRSWIQSAVVIMEEVTENVNNAITNSSTSQNFDVLQKLEQIVQISDTSPINVAIHALLSMSLFCDVDCKEADVDNSNHLPTDRWDSIRDRILEGVLRLFFCTGLVESIAKSHSREAADIVTASRLDHAYFWELVASNVVKSSPHVRDRAAKSVEFWGLSKGPISSLYALLFSKAPIPSLQFAAYFILSTEPISQLAVIKEAASSLDGDDAGDEDTGTVGVPSERSIQLKEELSLMIEKLPYEVLEMDMMAQERVNVFLAWSLLLSHLLSLPSLSPERDRLVQYVQDSASSVILDCLFQNIPLELSVGQALKKKDMDLPPAISEAASAARHAITTGSLLFSVESLWPIESKTMASLAGALSGLMLRVLPAYVRGWFTDLRDRASSSLVESFTRTWCSPPLIVNELSQIKKAQFTDENFSVSVSKSANEVVATYTKDETGMDLVIRLPASYPLRPVDVDCMRSLGISEVKQRKWLMSMMLFVRNQNGALAEAIRTWKSNFDKEFEGVEECPICYSVIHTTNHSLPRLACRTCKHKFHSACLYKWFSTSHKSSCPLCQSPF